MFFKTLTNIPQYHILIIVFISIFSRPLIAEWDQIHTIPELSTKSYPDVNAIQNNTISLDYFKDEPLFPMPIKPISSGDCILLKILIPPGTELANLFAQSGGWKGLMATEFNEDPGKVCDNSKLTVLLDGYNPSLYNDSTILQQAKYKYLVFKFTGNGRFSFTSINIQMIISNYILYNEWRNNRPWAGGPASNSIDGITGDKFELNITPPSNGSITIKNLQTNEEQNCIDNSCDKISYPKDTPLELKAYPATGFVFKEWQGNCTTNSEKIDENGIKFTMDTSKSCTAVFEEKPVTLTIIEPYPTNGFIINNVSNDIIINKNLFADNPNKYILCRDGMDEDLCDADYIKNTPAILVAVPDMGYTLDAWGEDCTGTDSYVVLTMNEDKNCSATFKECN